MGLKTCQPTHTGDLTVRKFAENYDYIHSTEGLLSRELYDDSTWARKPAPGHAQKPGRPQRDGPVLIAFVQSTISTLTF